eukprot:7384769-Prymnesium_polylepis.1
MPITNAYEGGQLLNQDFLSLTCAVKLAVKHVNERNDTVVPGLPTMVQNLTLLHSMLYDSGFGAGPSATSFLQMQEAGADALVGPARSVSALETAFLGKNFKMPQCSYFASATVLANKVLYPYFGRTYPSDDVWSSILSNLIFSLGWRTYVFIFDPNEAYSSSVASRL